MGLSLPDLAEDLAADAALGGLGARQDALRRRDDGQSEPAEDPGDLLLVAVDTAAGARDALDAVDDRLAVGRVLEVDPQRSLRLFLVRQRVVADEALTLEDAGDLHLQLRGRELHAVMMRHDPIADPRQHIGYWISHRHCSVLLPTCFRDARDVAAERELPETDAAELKLAEVSARAPAHFAAVDFAAHVLRLARRLDDHRGLGHLVLSALLAARHVELAQ